MNILFIAFRTAWPHHRGERVPIYYLSRELQRRGHSVDLLAFADRPSDFEEKAHYALLFHSVELIADRERPSTLYTQRLREPNARWPRRAADAWSPEMWRAIERHLDATRYDLIQVFGGAHVYEFFHALRGLPAIINPLDSQTLFLRRSLSHQQLNPRDRIERRALWMIVRDYESWMFAPFDRTVVVSDVDRNELLSLNPALQVEVIPNGVDLDLFRPQSVEREPATLIFVGDFLYAPNKDVAHHLATVVLPRVRQWVPNARLWLVGNEPSAEIQALANDHLTVTGYVPEVQPYLARATAFVSPLRLGSGIKNKVLEALAMGCPLVATPLSVDGIAVTDGHNALIADGDALIDATARLLEDAELRQKLSANGRALIEAQYSWMRVGQMYEALYEQVLASR
jgi:glycosyltransferase involved in cell wall biosynthesis